MTKCPDVDDLIAAILVEGPDAETTTHLEDCGQCRAELDVILGIRAAFAVEVPVDPGVVTRTLEVIDALPLPAPVAPSRDESGPLLHLGAATLGTMTTAAVVVAAGVGESGSGSQLLMYSLACGALCALWFALDERRARTRGDMEPAGV